MKKILLIEDNDAKRKALLAYLHKKGVPQEQVIVAKTMTDFAASLNADIGLFIIDLKLPNLDQVAASQNGKAILEAIIKAGKGDALLVAISSYPQDFPELRDFYESHGCILADFSVPKSWQSTLDHLLVQLRKTVTFDFIVFCALQEERNPYVMLLNGTQVVRGGIDCFDVTLKGRHGTVVLLPQMGVVNAAITAAACIERFSPSVVGMSGICGGFEKRAHLGQLFVSSMAYEYQSGKWITDGFMQEPYQVPTDHVTLTHLRALTNDDGLIASLEHGFNGARPTEAQKPDLGIFTSGSAVIADAKYMGHIEKIHRKVNALDMEAFGIHRAAELAPSKPPCICAKTVVDLGDKKKGDKIHAYGAYVSAKFLIRALEDYLERRFSLSH
jgi:nucleoside phosphorylase